MKSDILKREKNSAKTKALILTAAKDAFAEFGYASVSIRDIASRAGVASSLPMRYFGSKAALFEHALVDAIHTQGQFTLDKANFGKTMAHLMASASDQKLTMMIVLASGDPEAKKVVNQVAKTQMIEALEAWLEPPNEHARALAMLSIMTGFIIYVHQLGTSPPPELLDWVARALQDLVVPSGSSPSD